MMFYLKHLLRPKEYVANIYAMHHQNFNERYIRNE